MLGFAVKLLTHTCKYWSQNHCPLARVEPYCLLEEGDMLQILQEEGQLQPLTTAAEEEKDSLRWQEVARAPLRDARKL